MTHDIHSSLDDFSSFQKAADDYDFLSFNRPILGYSGRGAYNFQKIASTVKNWVTNIEPYSPSAPLLFVPKSDIQDLRRV